MPRFRTAAEADLLAHAWGPSALWRVPFLVYPDGPARVEFDERDPRATLTVHWPDDAPDSAKVHETGHAIHVCLFPESAQWDTLKCETFAMLGVVRLKLTAGYDTPLALVAIERATRIVQAHPLRYDLAMKMAAAETDG